MRKTGKISLINPMQEGTLVPRNLKHRALSVPKNRHPIAEFNSRSNINESKLPKYDSLLDPYLKKYFRNDKMKDFLVRKEIIDKSGHALKPKRPVKYFSTERRKPVERLPAIGRRDLDSSAIEQSINDSRIILPAKRYLTPTPSQQRQKIGLLETLIYRDSRSNQASRSRRILKSTTQKELNTDSHLQPLSSESLKQIFDRYKIRAQTPVFLSNSPSRPSPSPIIIKEEDALERTAEKFA